MFGCVREDLGVEVRRYGVIYILYLDIILLHYSIVVSLCQDLPICSPWTFRDNHSPNTIYTVNRRNQPTAMDLYFLDWVRTRYEPETHTKSAHTVL